MIYGRRALIQAYLDAQRYRDADEAISQDSQQFAAALQQAFGISFDELVSLSFFSPLGPNAMLFKRGVSAIQAQDEGVLEEGLLYKKLEEQGKSGLKIMEQYIEVGQAQSAVIERALALLMEVVAATWPNAPETLDSESLLKLGFDDSNRPDPMDFW